MAVMTLTLFIVGLALSSFTLLVSIVLLAEIIASLRSKTPTQNVRPYPHIAVLIPAHNENSNITPTLLSVLSQLRENDVCLVVADNCNDDTASIARQVGVEVIERHDPSKIGKGYALDFGIRHLETAPPSILVIIDADCRLSENGLAALCSACHENQRPVQALDLMVNPSGASPIMNVAEFAWRVKNEVRPFGLYNLGLPCQLMGTGMAFPWIIAKSFDVASGHIVEDLRLGLDLAERKKPALFCPTATVISTFPTNRIAAQQQRQRWEYGHLIALTKLAPQMLAQALIGRNVDLLVLTLDMMVPPLSLLVAILFSILLFSLCITYLGVSSLPLALSVASSAAFGLSLVLAWWRYGRALLPVSSFHLIAKYLAEKVILYAQTLSQGGVSRWHRTGRD
jgi:glycosyltransferase involved in cell wall biosynthesis